MDAPTRPSAGPVRSSTGKRDKKAESGKPYSRPQSSLSTSKPAGVKRSDSQASLFGGLKSVFKSFFSNGGEGTGSGEGETDDDPDRTRSVDGDAMRGSSDDESDQGEQSFITAPRRNGDGAVKRNPSSPEHKAQPSSKRPRRASPVQPFPDRGIQNSTSLGHANPSLASLTRTQGLKRSGTLLDLDLHRTRPSSFTGAGGNATTTNAWSPWTEQAEAHERKVRASATTGFARSGSIGYGLHASPARQTTSSLFAHASSAARQRTSLLHPLKSASLIRRSPSLPLGPVRGRAGGQRDAGAMRDPYERRETTALGSSPVTAQYSQHQQQQQQQAKRWREETEREQSPFRLPRDSSVLSGMSELVVREPTRGRQSMGTSEMFETQHKSEAERILATLSSMRASKPNPTAGTAGLSASYSSRTLRKQIAIPAPSSLRQETRLQDFATGSGGLGLVRRAREVEGDSVMVSPYGKRRGRGKVQEPESEESGEEERGREGSRMSTTPVREPSRKPTASPARQDRPDPTTFPSPASKPIPKPLPVAFSPSAKNLPSAATARAKTSSLRAKTTMTTRKHTSAAGSRHGGRFSAMDDDDEDEADGYSLDLAELEAAAEKREMQGGSSAFSSAPKITGPMDLFAPQPPVVEKPASDAQTAKSDAAQTGMKQAPGFLNVKADHRPRASSPLKAMVVPSPESNKTSSPSGSQPSESASPAFASAKPAAGATSSFFAPSESKESASSGKQTFDFGLGLGKPSAPAAESTSAFNFGTPAKTADTPASTTPAGPAPSSSFNFGPAEKTQPSAPLAFTFGASSSSGPPSFISAPADKPSAPPALAAPAEPKGVAPPKSTLFKFSTAPSATAAPVIPPAVASSLPAGNPFASVASTTAPVADKPAGTTGAFSFGSTSSTPATVEAKAPAQTTTSSLFGAPAQSSTSSLFGAPAQASATPTPSTPAFDFTNPAPAAPAPTTKSSFSFGATAEAPKPAASSAFTFGSTATAPAPATTEVAKPASSAFNFGNTAAPGSAPSSTPTFGGFGASSTTASPATATSFNFGSTAPSFGAPAPASTGFGAPPASNPFGAAAAPAPAPIFGGFGAVATPTPPASNSTFNFGAPTTPVANSPFAFGGGAPAAAAPAAAPTFGGFAAPAPAFGAREATATPPPMFSMGADNAPGSPGAAGRRIRGIPKRVKKP